MRKIKVIIIKPGTIEEKEIDDELDSYYKILSCDTIDIVRRGVMHSHYCFVVDDESLLKKNPVVCAKSQQHYESIYNGIIIARESGEDLASITDDDVLKIYSRFNQDKGVLMYD